MEEYELKPCPFCAAEYPHIMLNDRGEKAGMWRYFVECLNCESKTGIGVLTFGMESMRVQIERIREHFSVPGKAFDRVSAYNLAKEELYDEIAERYFSI